MSAIDTQRQPEKTATPGHERSLVGLWLAGTGLAGLLVTAAHFMAAEFADPLVVEGIGEVTLGNVLRMTVLGATVGAVLAYILGRFTRRPRMAFLTLTLVALAGYAVVPFTAAETLQTAIWLNVFHIAVAIPVISMLSRYVPGDRARIRS